MGLESGVFVGVFFKTNQIEETMTTNGHADIATINAEIEKCKEAERKLADKMKPLEKKHDALRAERAKVLSKRYGLEERAKLVGLIGQRVKLKPGATREGEKLHGARGTLTALKRTYASIDFGELGSWSIPMGHVTAEATQGIDDGMIVHL